MVFRRRSDSSDRLNSAEDTRSILISKKTNMLYLKNGKGEVIFTARVATGDEKGLKRITPELNNKPILAASIRGIWEIPNFIAEKTAFTVPKEVDGKPVLEDGKPVMDEKKLAEMSPTQMKARGFVKTANGYAQLPGPTNILGNFAIDVDPQHRFLIHSTNGPEIFDKENRSITNGCVRIKDIDKLFAHLRRGGTFEENLAYYRSYMEHKDGKFLREPERQEIAQAGHFYSTRMTITNRDVA
jgi:murein L,D-transpeptidase YcbB/YkuD